jgi:hypothetical protein
MIGPLRRLASRTDWASAALFLAAFVALLALRRYNLWDMVEGWIIADEGHQAYQPLRWLAGQWYYRDFATDNYPPGSIWLHAWLFDLFGVKLSVLRVFLAGIGAGIAAMAYATARRVMPAGPALLAYLLCLTWNVLNLNVGYPSWYCVLLGLAALPAIMRYTHTGHVRWLVVAGALAGLSLMFKTTQGAFQWIGLALFLAWRSAPSCEAASGLRRLLTWESGFAAAVLLVAGALLSSFPSPVNLLVFGAPLLLASLSVITGRPTRETHAASRAFLSEIFWLGLGLALVTAAWMTPTIAGVGWKLFIDGVFLAPLRHSAFMYAAIQPPGLNGWLLVVWGVVGGAWAIRGRRLWPAGVLAFGALGAALLFLPVPFSVEPREWLRSGFQTWRDLRFYLMGLVSLVVWIWLWRGRVERAQRPALVLLLTYGAWNFMQVYPFADSNHLLWSIQPAFIGLAYVASQVWEAAREKMDGPSARRAATLAVGVVPALCIALQVYPLAGHFYRLDDGLARVSYVLLDEERADIYVQEDVARELRGVKAAIESLTDTDDTIFDTSGPFFYFWSGRHNATKHDFLWPGFLTDDDVAGLVGDLQHERPALVIRRETDEHVIGYASFAETFPTVAQFIEAGYQFEARIGPYALWTPK